MHVWTKMSLANKTLVAMILGAIIGFIVGPEIVAIQIVGDIFLRILQMAIGPLIFFSVTVAIANMGDLRQLGRLGLKLFLLFMATTLASTTIGLIVARIIRPGHGLVLTDLPPVKALADAPSVTKVLLNIFPTNIMQAMSEANILQVIVFAIFSGVAILLLNESDRTRITGILGTLFRFIMRVLNIVMEFSPYGVFALMAVTAGKYGASVIGPLTEFILSIYVGLVIHVVVIYFGLYYLFTRKNPFTFFKKIRAIWITSFTTCSTKATMPVSMRVCEEELGIPRGVVGFTIPVGASMNMDGNGLWYGVVAIFVSQLVGIDISLSQQVIAVLLGVLMTLGSPGIPGGIFVATTIFLKSMGLPLEVIGLLAGIFRIMDMGITTVNVVGTAVVASIVGDGEKDPTAELSQG